MSEGQVQLTEKAGQAPQAVGGTLAVVPKGEEGQEPHAEVRRQVLALRDKSEEDSWALAAVLAQVSEGAYYTGWSWPTWREYVEQEVDIHIRKAQMLCKLEKWLNGLPKNVQTWIRALGWTKARMLVGRVTAENADEWRHRVSGKTVAEIDKMLHADAEEAAADPDKEGADATTDRQTPMKFKLSPDQKRNVEHALEVAARAAETTVEDRKGYLLDLICTEYLATNHDIKTVQEYLAQIERVIGLNLVAYDKKADEVVYGGALLDEIAGDDEEAEDPEDVTPEVDPEAGAITH